MTFQDRVAVITGGGTGIGKATAEQFLALGGKVVINGRRESVLRKTAALLDPTGKRVVAIPGDIASPKTAQALVDGAIKAFGRLDVVINNAGIFAPLPFLDHTEQHIDAYLGTILKGTFFTSQAAIRAMRNGGAIVNVGSMWASQAVGATPSSAYSAAKAAVHALTHNLAIEFAKDNIRVNTVAPAVVRTPVYEAFLPVEQIPTVLDSFNAFHPLGRIGQPEDVVSAILFLSSDESSWITGAVLPVDGGIMAGRT